MSYTSVPNTEPYDYFIYKDAFDANKIKARNSRTAKVEFNHATDFGNVYNSCVAALPVTGGVIEIGSGTFETATTCTFKNYLTVRGGGMNVTIIKLANSANKDVMATPTFDAMIAARPATGYGIEAGVIHDVTLQDISIDGNKANNPTGRYGLVKIAYGWNLTNVIVYNCKLDGIYSEWGTVAGCPGVPDPTRRCMEDYWINVYMHHCDGQGLRFRGPHDTYMVNIMSWGNFDKAASWEAVGTLYSGGSQVHQYHCFATTNPAGTIMTEISALLIGTNWAVEGGQNAAGMGLKITGSSRVQLSGSRIFNNEVGIKIDGGVGYALLEGNQYDGNVVGIQCYGVQNKITGTFLENDTDIELGHPSVAAGHNDIRAKCTRSNTALKWRNAGNINNYVDLSVVLLAGDVAINESEASPNLNVNYVSIWSIDSTNFRVPAVAGRYMPYPSHMPSYKKYGVFFGGSANAGEGLFHGLFTPLGTATHPTPADVDGKFIRYTSAATLGAWAGIRLPYPISKQAWRPTMRARFKIENTDVRVFCGWKGNPAVDATGDDPLNAEVGLYFGKVASSASWQVLRNDGVSTTVISNVTGNPAPTTGWNVVDYWADATGWGLRFNGGADIHFTTDIPLTSHYMAIVFEIQTTSAAARYIDIHYVELSQEK